MLEHHGRTSGQRRHVVLEVVDHPSPDRYVVVSGFGQRAQWFRNVATDPRVRVYVGGHKPMQARAHPEDPRAVERLRRSEQVQPDIEGRR